MGGSFGGMMMRHARALGYTAERDGTVHYEDLPKKKRKVIDHSNPELEAIQERYRKAIRDAGLEFMTGIRENYGKLMKAGLLQHGDLARDVLQRAKKGKLLK